MRVYIAGKIVRGTFYPFNLKNNFIERSYIDLKTTCILSYIPVFLTREEALMDRNGKIDIVVASINEKYYRIHLEGNRRILYILVLKKLLFNPLDYE